MTYNTSRTSGTHRFSLLLTFGRSDPILLPTLGRSENMSRQTSNEQVLQGTLDLLILKTLSLSPLHGWGLTHRIEQLSQEALQVGQGSIYPARLAAPLGRAARCDASVPSRAVARARAFSE